jgi:tetratricopeptide repeat protein 21B
MSDATALIDFYCQAGYYRQVQTVCQELLQKRGEDSVLLFWQLFGLAKEGKVNHAIQELAGLRGKRDVELPVCVALAHWHACASLKDHDAISELRNAQHSLEDRALDSALLLTATFLWHVGDLAEARKIVERVLQASPDNVRALALQGWIAVSGTPRERTDNAEAAFDRALTVSGGNGGKKDLTALMGKAKFYSLSSRFRDSLAVLKQAMLTYPWFVPALIEEAKLLMMIGDWDQSLETARRVLQQDEFDIEALRVQAMYLLARGEAAAAGGNTGMPLDDDHDDGSSSNKSHGATVRALDKLTEAIGRYEPKNAQLMFEVSQPLARLASRQDAVLKRTARMVDQAAKLDRTSCAYVNELAYQYTLMRRYDKAMRTYEQAAQIDESDATALYGQIYCLVQQGELEDASQQLEFFAVVQESIGRTANLAYLGALLAWRRDRDRDASIAQLNEAVDLHVKALRDPRPTTTYDYFVRFNPDLLMEISGEYLQFCGSEPMDAGELPCRHLTRGTKLLEKVAAQAPGLLSAQMALAGAKFVSNDLDDTVRILDRCLETKPSFADAHLLLARVHLLQGDTLAAQSSLDQALAHDFTVRNSLKYMLPKAQVLLAKADLDEAHTVLQAAIDMPGVRSRGSGNGSSSSGKGGDVSVSEHDRASVFIQYAHINIALNRESEAVKTMAQAAKEFRDTPEEVRVVLANAQIALKRGDTGAALRMLGNVPRDSPAFLKSQTLRADIYLTHRNNKHKYVKCYMDLVECWPGNPQMYVLLGEAYMKVSLSDEAIQVFEQALKKNPKDHALARRIGRALVSTHDYNRAIEYYKTALTSTGIGKDGVAELKFDLAQLYQRLGRYDEASAFLEVSKNNSNGSNSRDAEGKDGGSGGGGDDEADTAAILAANGDSGTLVGKVRQTLLLAKVVEGGGDVDEAGRVLERARDLQTMVLEAVRGKGAELLQRQRAVMADICERLAQHHEQHAEHRDENKAIAFHKEALRFEESSVEATLALAKLYLARGDLENCQQRCVALTRIDPHNEQASMMLAELMFQRNDMGMAIHYYEKLLEVNPANFDALANVILLVRRAGELPKAQRFLKAAERASPRSAHDPGFFYCKGLYSRYANDINAAIANFNRARKDPTWGRRALVHMVEVYLNPDNANMWDDENSSGSSRNLTAGGGDDPVDPSHPSSSPQQSDSQAQRDAVETAKQLLDEFPESSANDTQYQILKCYAMMATRVKNEIEMACAQLVALANDDKENVPALLALATALMMMRQTPKARNQLKRISKLSFNATQAEEFEKCWLLLTDIYISSGKYDLAQDLCKRCLQYNKSCARAWEYMGVIMEKEASYKDAAFHYESAWKHQGKASASIGYKLAFNYLKAQRYLDAIDVANQVIQQFPGYPKIRQDVLAKARAALRP